MKILNEKLVNYIYIYIYIYIYTTCDLLMPTEGKRGAIIRAKIEEMFLKRLLQSFQHNLLGIKYC